MRAAATLATVAAFVIPQAGEPPENRPAFPAGVEWVTVDAVVLDRDGRPLRGLTVEDFTLKEDGVPQKITAFEAIEPASAPAHPAGAAALPVVSSTAAVAAPRPGRVFVVVFDDYHLEHGDTPRARAAIRAFVDALADGDRLTLVTPGGGLWWQARIPDGREAVLSLLSRLPARPRTGEHPQQWMTDDEAIRIRDGDTTVLGYVVRRWGGGQHAAGRAGEPRRAPNRGGSSPLEDQVRDAAIRISFDVQRRTRATLDVLVRALASLSGVRGRKSVLLVSGGFVRDPAIPEFTTVLAVSQRANAAIYFVDARGLGAVGPHLSAESGVALDMRNALQDTALALGALDAQSQASEGLASDTGGFSIRKTNDLGNALSTVARESTAYYLLGYAAPPGGRKPRFRRIDVQVSRAGIRVRARRGYFPAAAGQKPSSRDELQQAVDSPFDADAIPLRAASFVLDEKSPGTLRVLLTTDIDVRALSSDAQGRTLDYVVSVSDGAGAPRRSDESLRPPPPGAEGWVSFTRQALLPPGAYQARIVVREVKSGLVGSLVQDFEVPQPAGLRVSTPVLSDRLRAGEGSGPEMMARRTFTASGTLHGRFEVYSVAAAGSPLVKAGFTIRDEDGGELAAAAPTQLVRAADGTLGRSFGVPLADAPPGRYELVVVAEDEASGARAEARGSFFVEGATPR